MNEQIKKLFTPISERLPKESGTYCVLIKDSVSRHILLHAKFNAGGFWGEWSRSYKITHWLDLDNLIKIDKQDTPLIAQAVTIYLLDQDN